jgi:hypothetical protein
MGYQSRDRATGGREGGAETRKLQDWRRDDWKKRKLKPACLGRKRSRQVEVLNGSGVWQNREAAR